MDTIIIAIVIAIVVAIIIIAIAAQCTASKSARETLTTDQCGNTSTVSLPYDPLSRYEFFPNKDSRDFADISLVANLNSNVAQRHKDLANTCDGTPGCIAFNTSGYLKSGVLPPASRANATYSVAGGGLYVRKCAVSEPRYGEFYLEKNYSGTRFLVPPGSYADVVKISNTVDGGTIPNDKIKSIKVPPGLKVTVYRTTNFGGQVQVFGRGDYPDLSIYKTGRLAPSEENFSKCISSIKIEYVT